MERQGEYLRHSAMSGDMSRAKHMEMMERRRKATLWCHFANMILGCWLIFDPLIFGYSSIVLSDLDLARVARERQIADLSTRIMLMTWSDLVSGFLIVGFSILSAKRVSWAQWANACVGTWLMFAPLLFWTPSPASYGSGLLIGGFVIAFSVLVPMMPGMSMSGMMQMESVPPGWDYNPSTWLQRIPIAALAVLGILLARYLAAYQLGHIRDVWDPFFGSEPNGTETIISSKMSRAWPVSDAGVGVMAYMFELLMAVMGDARRWRTMPWMVAAFGIVVVPLGAVSVFFIIAQPIVVDTWCTLCLVQALAMVVMMPYALDELVAMGQFLKDAKRRGKPFWRCFFMGDAMEGASSDQQEEFSGPFWAATQRGMWGVNAPWNLLLVCAIGLFLMFSRLVYGSQGAMANSDHLVGSLVITISVLALAEVARPLRFLNVPLGVWLLVSPWMLDGGGEGSRLGSVALGIALVILSLRRGPIRHRYGNWNALLK